MIIPNIINFKYSLWMVWFHLDLSDDLSCGVQVLVVADGSPGHQHGNDEDDDIDGDNDHDWAHEGPDEALLGGEPAVLWSTITPEIHGLIADHTDDDNEEGEEVANDVVGDDAKLICPPDISHQLINVKT